MRNSYNSAYKAIFYPMSLYIILKKINYGKINGNDYLFLLRDKMVTKKCLYVIVAMLKQMKKKHFYIIFMKNQKKNPK